LRRIADERFTCFDEYAAVAPRGTIISSTGIKKGVRDVPMLCKPLYAALEVPHKDKMQMERLLTLEQERKESLLCYIKIYRESFDHSSPFLEDVNGVTLVHVVNESQFLTEEQVHSPRMQINQLAMLKYNDFESGQGSLDLAASEISSVTSPG
jgi:hypothetical protein